MYNFISLQEYLKPYQGLKYGQDAERLSAMVEKYLKPYQGFKLIIAVDSIALSELLETIARYPPNIRLTIDRPQYRSPERNTHFNIRNIDRP